MAKNTVVSSNAIHEEGYVKLVGDVRALIEEGRIRAQIAAGKELTLTYWKIGKRILDENLPDTAGYFTSVLEDLSEELLIDATTLHRCISFVKTYPILEQMPPLTWSQCKLLMPIADTKKREYYEELVEKNKMNFRDLRQAIKKGEYEERILEKSKKRTSSAVKIDRPTEATYVYKAIVERVIDGDTILARIDLGFDVWRSQRIRLASVDAPAMDEAKGQEAYRYVLDKLAGVEFVMIKTNKVDIYGRYVGHIFYSAKETDKVKIFESGNYLNSELIEKNLAILF